MVRVTDSEKVLDLINSAIAAGRRFCNKQVGCGVCQYNKYGAKCLEAFWAEYLVKNGAKFPVKCKDCVNYHEFISGFRCIRFNGGDGRAYQTSPDHFCSYGERRESNP